MSHAPVRAVLLVLLAVGCVPSEADRRPPPLAPTEVGGGPPAPGAVETTAPIRYRPPVTAPVVDGFRPPPHPFGAGNRGIEYDTRPGDPVGAIAPGAVVFSGAVGGSRHVTVLHGDGVRSSYSYLATSSVAIGDRVGSGQTVGTAGPRLHLGVRAGDAYLDPALLFARDEVHLVPVG